MDDIADGTTIFDLMKNVQSKSCKIVALKNFNTIKVYESRSQFPLVTFSHCDNGIYYFVQGTDTYCIFDEEAAFIFSSRPKVETLTIIFPTSRHEFTLHNGTSVSRKT